MPSAGASEQKFIEGVPIIRDAFARTIRLVTTARLRDLVLKALADTDEELAQLAEIEGATSARLLAQDHGSGAMGVEEFVYGVPQAALINASFAYAKPREPNRFNGPDRGAWYAALDVETCLAEVVFHMTEFLARTGVYEGTVEYAELFASLAGEYLDLRSVPDHPSLNPDPVIGYATGNVLADTALAQGINGIVYPSVRQKRGTCFAVLRPHAVQSVAQGGVLRAIWFGNATPKIERISQ